MKRALLVATALLAGCTTHGLGITGDSPGGADLSGGEVSDYVDGDLGHSRNKVDILFMVDNSLSMQSKQVELRARFGDFAHTLERAAATHPASYHVGVVTSDLGAGTSFGVCRGG